MKKRLVIGLLVVVAGSSVAWTDAHADFLFNSSVVCGSLSATGRIQITSAGVTPPGAFKLTMSGLPPGVSALCTFVCFVNQTNFGQFACGTANASGRISFTAPGVIDPAAICAGPVAQLNLSNGEVCFTGWGPQ
jgi:hypothetical protein